MSTANLAIPLRTAIVENYALIQLLATYKGAPAVFTRLPAPNDALYPMITISPDLAVGNEDGVNDWRPVIIRGISVYSKNDTAAEYRDADDIAYRIRNLFHRQRDAITVPHWNVIDIQAQGPEPVFQDDQSEGRVVTLTVRLAQLRT